MSILIEECRQEIFTGDVTNTYAQQYLDHFYTLSRKPINMLDEFLPTIELTGEEMLIDAVQPADDDHGKTGRDITDLSDGSGPVRSGARFEATPWMHEAWIKRALTSEIWKWGSPISRRDLNVMRFSPTEAKVTIARNAMLKRRNQIALAGIGGRVRQVTRSVVNGVPTRTSNTIDFPTANIIDADGNHQLTIGKIDQVRETLEGADVDVQLENPIWILGPKQKTDLFGEDRVVSSDFSVSKPLASGQLPVFEGFRFVVMNGLDTETVDGNNRIRDCYCLVPRGVQWASEKALYQSFKQLPEKCDDFQLYMEIAYGCTRIDDAMVYRIRCLETISAN